MAAVKKYNSKMKSNSRELRNLKKIRVETKVVFKKYPKLVCETAKPRAYTEMKSGNGERNRMTNPGVLYTY